MKKFNTTLYVYFILSIITMLVGVIIYNYIPIVAIIKLMVFKFILINLVLVLIVLISLILTIIYKDEDKYIL